MREDVRQLMQGLVDHVGDDLIGRIRALGEPLKQSIRDRLISETSGDRRKMLAALADRISDGWPELAQVFDEGFRRKAAIVGGWQEDDHAQMSSESPLQLVSIDQVEWDLALAGALSRMKNAGGEALSEFQQRLSGVLGLVGATDANSANPVSVDIAMDALKLGIERLITDTAEKRAVVAYLEPLVSNEMAPLFANANKYLADHGVELRRAKPVIGASRTSTGTGAGGGYPASHGGSEGIGGGHSGIEGGGVPGNFMSLLQRLVQTTPGFAPGGGDGRSAAGVGGSGSTGAAMSATSGMVAVPAAMLESLERLQEIDLKVLQAGPASSLTAASGQAGGGNVLRELHQQEFARQLPPIEAATIDIVAMLFDFIFDDDLIPDTVKALVGRLQIPLLKVAMLDKSFFTNREHPARALLDTISRISIASGKGLDHGDPVFERIKSAVNQVLTQFEKDQGVFTPLVAEMRALLAEQEKLANDMTEKSKAVAERQEQSEIAEAKADEAFAHLLAENGGDALPAAIRDFLTEHWTKVLSVAFLKGGIDGHLWTLATQTLNDLLWSLTPKSGREERQRLVTMIPMLLRHVNTYLDEVGVTPEEKAPFFDAMVEIHSGAMKHVHHSRSSKSSKRAKAAAAAAAAAGTTLATPAPAESAVEQHALTPSPALTAGAESVPAVVVTRIVHEDGMEVESMALASKAKSRRPLRTSEVGKLERGDWVEFKQEDGTKVRSRLSWVSPLRGIMLFTNPQSTKAISISPDALALQMARGLATRLAGADEPLVDRALGKAMDTLKAA